MTIDPEEATRLAKIALHVAFMTERDIDKSNAFQNARLALRDGDLRIVSDDLLRILQKAGVVIAVVSEAGRRYETTSLCLRLIDKVALGKGVFVDREWLAALEGVPEAAPHLLEVHHCDLPCTNGAGCAPLQQALAELDARGGS